MAGSEYYNHTTFPATGAAGNSSDMRAELDAIETGFGKLPDLSGNGNKVLRVDSGGTALTVGVIVDDGTDATIGGNNIGYLEIPQNSKSAAYTCVLADAGKHILHPSADTTARIFTIPANASVAFPVGTAITFINQVSAGVVTITITSDTMRLAGLGTTGSRTLAANGIATAVKITTTEWIISGSGLA